MSWPRLSKEPLSSMQREHFRREPGVNERGEIEGLIQGVKSVWNHGRPPSARMAPLAVDAMAFIEENGFREAISRSIAGKPFIDLGAGYPWEMMRFASMRRASTYIAVDRYFDYSGLLGPRASFVNEDMLRFLAHQPNRFANISMNAIDDIVLMDREGAVHAPYAERLMTEVARIVPQGGIAFGIGTPFLHLLEGLGFERLHISVDSMVTAAMAIYRKPA